VQECVVEISRFAEKQIKKIPKNIKEHLYFWVKLVETEGLTKTRKIAGFHDEALQGKRKG